MSRPVRVQLSRKKGWRMPENTVSVARPGFWGNPYRVVLDEVRHTGEWDENDEPIMGPGPWLCQIAPKRPAGIWFSTKQEAAERAVALFRLRLTSLPAGKNLRDHLHILRGKNLACWCPLDQPCHADVLLELANA